MDIIKGAEVPQELPAVEADEEMVPTTEGDVVGQNGSTGDLETPGAMEDPIDKPMENYEKVAGEFNEGAAPTAEIQKTKDAMPSQVIETTESTVVTKETVAQAEAEKEMTQVSDDPEALASPGATPVVVEKEMNLIAKVEELEAKVKMMEESNASKMQEIEKMMLDREEEMKAQVEKSEEFQNLAVEAIDSIAQNSVSGFKASTSKTAVSNPTAGMSIFRRAQYNANLAKNK
jgi:hypothetical protein